MGEGEGAQLRGGRSYVTGKECAEVCRPNIRGNYSGIKKKLNKKGLPWQYRGMDGGLLQPSIAPMDVFILGDLLILLT